MFISYIQATLSSFWRQNGDSFKSHSKHPVLKKKLKRSDTEDIKERERRAPQPEAGYENASEKVGNAFLQIGESSFKSEYFGKIPGSDVKPGSHRGPVLTTPAPTKPASRKCYVKPQKKCKTTPKQDCKQVRVLSLTLR